jgi:hypothetical protein
VSARRQPACIAREKVAGGENEERDRGMPMSEEKNASCLATEGADLCCDGPGSGRHLRVTPRELSPASH